MDETPQEHQPGQVVAPQPTDAAVDQAGAAPEPERPVEQPPTIPNPQPEPEPVTQADSTPTETSTWQFNAENTDDRASPEAPAIQPGEEISWTASEFIAHEKSAGWYVGLVVTVLVVVTLVFLVTSHDILTTSIVGVMAIIVGILAARKPRVQQYALESGRVLIGTREYLLQGFKSFSVDEDGAIVGIVFMPLKRFSPSLTVYLAPDIEDKVVQILSERLPMEAHKQDAIDTLLKRIRY